MSRATSCGQRPPTRPGGRFDQSQRKINRKEEFMTRLCILALAFGLFAVAVPPNPAQAQISVQFGRGGYYNGYGPRYYGGYGPRYYGGYGRGYYGGGPAYNANGQGFIGGYGVGNNGY